LRSMDLLGTSPEFIDANEELLEQQLRAKCNVKLDRNAVIGQLKCLACHEIAPEDYRILSPTLVIGGQDDRIIPSSYARKMSECIPGSRFIELARCGHNPFEEMPNVVLPHIIEFLTSRPNKPGLLSMAGHAGH